MTHGNTVVYVKTILHHVLANLKPRDTHHGQHVVVICDGVGVHFGMNVLNECIRHGIELVLRCLTSVARSGARTSSTA
jgi:hypothetical protein